MPEPPKRAAHYGTGYAGDGFRGIGGDLLRTFPPLAIDPTAPAFAVHGAHLLAAIVLDPDGFRTSACPVCRTRAILPYAGGWIPLRCESCGTEFVATDGSPPPPPAKPPPPPPPLPPPPPDAELLRRNLERWVASGEPDRWVTYRKGVWSETEVAGLLESLCFTAFWPLDPAAARVVLDEAAGRYRASSSLAASLRWLSGYGRYAVCPGCGAHDVKIPRSAGDEVRLTCPGCGTRFRVKLPPLPPPKPWLRPAVVKVAKGLGCFFLLWVLLLVLVIAVLFLTVVIRQIL